MLCCFPCLNAQVVDFDTRSSSKPLCVEWCGKDAVVMRWANTGVVMVGPFGDWLNFPPDSTGLCVVPEPDCCRIVSNKVGVMDLPCTESF